MSSNPYYTIPVNPAFPVDPLHPLGQSGFSGTSILNNIYSSIINLTSILQNATSAQANRINLFTQLQAAYTNQLAAVPTFTTRTYDPAKNPADYGSYFSFSASELKDAIAKTTAYTQTLQNRQSVVANAAKALQSNVDQSNSAVNAQSTLATTLVQQYSTLLASAFSH